MDLSERFFVQLCYGCDLLDCKNHFCRGSPHFQFSLSSSPDELRAQASSLASTDPEGHKLCSGLSPAQLDPSVQSLISKFPSVPSLLRFDDTTAENFARCLVSPLTYPHLFCTHKRFQYSQDMGFDETLLRVFSQTFIDQIGFFQRFSESFEITINSSSPASIPSATTIRGVLITMFFLSLFLRCNVSQSFLKCLAQLRSFGPDLLFRCQVLVGDALSSCPFLFSAILGLAQETVTFLIIPTRFKKSVLDPEFQRVAIFVGLLYAAASRNSLTQLDFANDLVGDVFNTEIEEDRIDHRHGNLLDYYPLLPLKTKMEFFEHLTENSQEGREFVLAVHREHVVEDTIRQLPLLNSQDRFKVNVQFQGEHGVDAGGLSQEYFFLLCEEMFSPDHGMFLRLTDGKYWFASGLTADHQPYKMLGKVVAIAAFNRVVLPVRFPLVVYKKLQGIPVCFRDLKEIDPDVYESMETLKKMRDQGEDIAEAGLRFVAVIVNYGIPNPPHPLKPGGEEIDVTNENLDEYVNLYLMYVLIGAVEDSFQAFKSGFSEFMAWKKDRSLIDFFCFDELDRLISGDDIIDWKFLKESAQYTDGYSSRSRPIVWFWEIFEEMSEEDRKRFIRFSTGCDRIPLIETFSLVIQRTNDVAKLPVSHTCFTTFALPPYASKEEMRQKIMIAIQNDSGFGLV
jgi:ubiquitin-protein ligase E3 A